MVRREDRYCADVLNFTREPLLRVLELISYSVDILGYLKQKTAVKNRKSQIKRYIFPVIHFFTPFLCTLPLSYKSQKAEENQLSSYFFFQLYFDMSSFYVPVFFPSSATKALLLLLFFFWR